MPAFHNTAQFFFRLHCQPWLPFTTPRSHSSVCTAKHACLSQHRALPILTFALPTMPAFHNTAQSFFHLHCKPCLPFTTPRSHSSVCTANHACFSQQRALPIHCLSTAYSLPLHTAPPHCSSSLLLLTAPPHCLCTAYALPIHCLSTAYPLLIHCLFTAYSLPIHCLFTAYALPMHCLFAAYSLPVHCLATTLCTLLY
jgi:hypothetical protein